MVSLSNSQKSFLKSSIEDIFDFSNQDKEEFINDVKQISDSLQGKQLDKDNKYRPLQNAFFSPEKAFTNLEKQGYGKITVKEVQKYITDFADEKISNKAEKLNVKVSDTAWEKDAVKVSKEEREFQSVQNQNLGNMSFSNDLRQ